MNDPVERNWLQCKWGTYINTKNIDILKKK